MYTACTTTTIIEITPACNSSLRYASYQMVQKLPGGDKMTGFTRILHRTVPDILMEEVGSGDWAGGLKLSVGRRRGSLPHTFRLIV